MAIKQNNKTQSDIRFNLSNILGLSEEQAKMVAQNQDRLRGGIAQTYFNGRNAGTESGGTEPTCTPCGGGGGSGGGGSGGGVQPSGNCEKKNISDLKQVLDDYANQSFCDKEFPDVQFSTFIGYDKQPSNNTAKEIELRMLCPSDECNDDEELCSNADNLRVNPVSLYNNPALYAVRFTVRLSCNDTNTTLDEYSFYDVFKVEPNTKTEKYDAGSYYWYYTFYPESLVNTVQGWYNELVGCSSTSCACCEDHLPIVGETWGNGSGSGYNDRDIYLLGLSCCKDLDLCSRHRRWQFYAETVSLSVACENLRK